MSEENIGNYDLSAIMAVVGDLAAHKECSEQMANIGKLAGCVSDLQHGRMMGCGSYVGMQYDVAGRLRVTESNFCRARLCPMCAWRKSLRAYIAIQDMVAAMPGYDYILCTVTVPNVDADRIGDTLTRMYHRWRDMLQMRQLRAWAGWLRSTEITYNALRGDYHPHIHALVAVAPTYWHSRAYVPQAALQALWGLGIVDVRRIRDIAKGAAEVAKYACKPLSLREIPDAEQAAAAYKAIYNGLHGRRLVQSGGCVRATLRQLRIDIDNETTEGQTVEGAPLLALSWDGRRYRCNAATRGFDAARARLGVENC